MPAPTSSPGPASDEAGDRIVLRAAAAVVAAFVLAAAGFLLATMGRGFSYGDEGFYHLTTAHPGDMEMLPQASAYYTRFLDWAAGGSIAGFRTLTLAALLGSAAALALGFGAFLRSAAPAFRGRSLSVLAAGFLLAGQLVYYVWFLRGGCYNSLTAIASNLILGLLLGMLSLSPEAFGALRAQVRRPALAAIGLCLGLLLFSKPPAFLAIGLCAAAAFGLAPVFRGRRLSAAMFAGAGLAAGLLFHFAFLQPFPVWYRAVRDGVRLYGILTPNYDPHLYLHYPRQITVLFREALWNDRKPFAVACVLFAAVGIGLRNAPARLRGRLLGSGIGLLFAFHLYRLHAEYRLLPNPVDPSDGIVRLCFLWLTLAGGLWALAFLFRRGEGSRDRVVTLALGAALCFLFPLGDVVGTNRPVTMTLAWYLAPWFALLFLLLGGVARSVRSAVPLAVPTVLLAGTACLTLYWVGWHQPFRMPTGLPRQDVPVTVGAPPRPLRVDAASAAFLNAFQGAARSHGFVPGTDVLDFGHAPELVFFLGGRAPVSVLAWSGYPGYRDFCRFVLSRIPPARLRAAWIVQQADAVATTPDLSEFGLRFPDGYVSCGTFDYPPNGQAVTLWKPRGG